MIAVLLLALQAAAPPADAAPPAAQPATAQAAPDIALDIRVRARDVRIERRGETSLEVRAGPDGGTLVDVDRPDSNGRTRLRNVDVRVRAEARIADPAGISTPSETPSPQRR